MLDGFKFGVNDEASDSAMERLAREADDAFFENDRVRCTRAITELYALFDERSALLIEKQQSNRYTDWAGLAQAGRPPRH